MKERGIHSGALLLRSMDGEMCMIGEYILEMKGICKSFPGVVALDHVNLQVQRNEVHALMGENGAGKSTLIKIMTGVYSADEGEILFDGKKASISDVASAQAIGISPVYQELNMIPHLSVAENIFLGRYPRKPNGNIDWKTLNANAKRLMDEMDLAIDVRALLSSFGTATQQMVSIVRAVSSDARLVLLDEPTSSLDAKEVKVLFGFVRKLQQKGIAFVFITHRLDEVFEISDRITILKDGQYVGTFRTEDMTRHELVTRMVGREVTVAGTRQDGKSLPPNFLLEARHLKRFPKVNDISFGIRKGEVVGLAGMLGSGRTETAQLLFGCAQPDAGEIWIEGQPTQLASPMKAIMRGFAYVPENRRTESLISNMSVKNNIVLSSMKQVSSGAFIDEKKRRRVVESYIQKLRIKTPNMEQSIRFLSGGNQQKVILARWLATNPRLIILDEPTRGIDVGAKQEVERLINEFADRGISVLYISSEIPELVRNCNRVVVIRDGVVIGEIQGDELSESEILRMISTGKSA